MWIQDKEREAYSLSREIWLSLKVEDVASCDIIKEVSNLYFQNALHRVRSKREYKSLIICVTY